ncbi:MAG: hypothetical protein QOI48_3684 [Solirubrobacteraceae bacterium]|nr:hypothetical protein [Solirubrobacteraceae bacterium]
MTIAPEHEAPRAASDPAFRDAVTFSFGDPASELYGLARVGVGEGGASGLAIVYAGSEPVAANSASGVAVDAADGWENVSAAGVRSTVETPLESWTVSYEGGRAAFELRFEAVSAPAALGADAPLASAGGIEGYEQLCVVTGTVRNAGRSKQVRCLGQRGHLWGAPDWKRVALARTLSAWMGADRALTLTTVRPAKARHHDEELSSGFLFEDGEPRAIADPRLSTTYDGDLRQRRAGLELWVDEEDPFARRVAGEVLCGTTIELGDLRLDSAFFLWRMEGREGTGRYDVLRRVNGGSRKR